MDFSEWKLVEDPLEINNNNNPNIKIYPKYLLGENEPVSLNYLNKTSINISQPAESFNQTVIDLQRLFRGLVIRKKIVSSPEYKKYQMKEQVVSELISSEEVYINILSTLKNDFFNPIKKLNLISDKRFDVLSTYIDNFYTLNKQEFYDRLIKRRNNPNNNYWADIFETFVEKLKFYSPYVNSYDQACELLDEQYKKNIKFRNWMKDPKQKHIRGKSPAQNHLVTPIQRGPRYVLFIKRLLKYIPPSNPDYKHFKQIFKRIKIIADEINEKRDELLSVRRLRELTIEIKKLNFNLAQPGRFLIKEGEIKIFDVQQKSKHFSTKKQTTFLLTDFIISTFHTSSNSYTTRFIIPLVNTIEHKIQQLTKTSFMFMINFKEYHFQHNDEIETQEWIEALNQTLQRNLEKKRSFLDLVEWRKLPVNWENGPKHHKSGKGVIYKNSLYYFGGEPHLDKTRLFSNDLFKLDLVKLKWETVLTVGNKPSPRSEHSLTLFDKKLFLIGGKKNKIKYADLYSYTFDTKKWTKLTKFKGNLPSKRSGHTATVAQDKIWIFGGKGEDGKYLNDLYMYDPLLNIWKFINPIGKSPPAREKHSCTFQHGYLMVVGGIGRNRMSDIWCYSLKKNKWFRPEIRGIKNLSNRYSHSSLHFRDKIYIIGNSEPLNSNQAITAVDLQSKTCEFVNSENSPKLIGENISCFCNNKLNQNCILVMCTTANQLNNLIYTLKISSRKWVKETTRDYNIMINNKKKKKTNKPIRYNVFKLFPSNNSKEEIKITNKANSTINHLKKKHSYALLESPQTINLMKQEERRKMKEKEKKINNKFIKAHAWQNVLNYQNSKKKNTLKKRRYSYPIRNTNIQSLI
ncbi:faciogenital dysplasia protein [Anaeramoeba flamelloides]|uniref:Faciogenital dysplasia protein n=1 Tax=Anaeramoeba flamelloides TaxID=1746091 RepID=A0AAV7ZLW6_9EUKA|nr:faciogenital dysplasia protein [Anaeramoeba flamelloides]